MNVYELSRQFWDWAFENPDKIKPNHSAMYFFAIEHCNRLGWKDKFGFPTAMVMDAIGIKNSRTFINTLNDLIEFGFIKMIEKSKNQYSANIIAIVKNTKAHAKALDKASQKHLQKQVRSIYKSIDTIDKPIYNITNLQVVEEVAEVADEQEKISDLKNLLKTKKQIQMDRLKIQHKLSEEELCLKIDEFVEKKVSWDEDDWRNDGDMARNFEFWLIKNPKPVNTFKAWTKAEFWEKVKAIPGNVSETTRRNFFDHWAMPSENGKMQFQNTNAWDTKTKLKQWLNRQNQFTK